MTSTTDLPRTTRPSDLRGHPDLRVGDAERRAAEDVLAQAWSLGYLGPDELDERLDRLLASVVRADVASVLADLPLQQLRRSDPRRRQARQRAARVGLRWHAVVVAMASCVVVAVWVSVAIGAGVWFPWFAFPVLGGGAGVALHALVVRLCLPQTRAVLGAGLPR